MTLKTCGHVRSRDKLNLLNIPHHNAYSHQTYPLPEEL